MIQITTKYQDFNSKTQSLIRDMIADELEYTSELLLDPAELEADEYSRIREEAAEIFIEDQEAEAINTFSL